ncbi:unnamed protein product, partial [Musa banksii]
FGENHWGTATCDGRNFVGVTTTRLVRLEVQRRREGNALVLSSPLPSSPPTSSTRSCRVCRRRGVNHCPSLGSGMSIILPQLMGSLLFLTKLEMRRKQCGCFTTR